MEPWRPSWTTAPEKRFVKKAMAGPEEAQQDRQGQPEEERKKMMERITVREVVKRLIGPVTPLGETTQDERRFENLKALTELVDYLLGDISRVSAYKDSPAFSESRAGQYAAEYLNEVKEVD